MPGNQGKGATSDAAFVVDPFRSLVFPNALRGVRKHLGFQTLLAMAERIPEIPYVRLSKIERGEVFAKPEELTAIAAVLAVPAEALLIDVDARDFDIARWASDLQDWEPTDPAKDRFAVLLGAAVRRLRAEDGGLTIAAIEQRFRIAPVILSRIENAAKPLDRWNAQTVSALCRMFDVSDAAALRKAVKAMERQGVLQTYAAAIADPAHRIAKTGARVAGLREALRNGGPVAKPARATAAQPASKTARPAPAEGAAAMLAEDQTVVRLLPVFGVPIADGLIARTPIGEWVEAPRSAGPDGYGLRVCRPTLGLGLPASATVVVDPGRFPSSGGIAVVEEGEGLRILAVTFDRHGRMMGYSESPSHEVAIDGFDPARVATILSAVM